MMYDVHVTSHPYDVYLRKKKPKQRQRRLIIVCMCRKIENQNVPPSLVFVFDGNHSSRRNVHHLTLRKRPTTVDLQRAALKSALKQQETRRLYHCSC
jgi:hypothetical protein